MNGAPRFPWRRLATLALAWVVVGFTINALMVVAIAGWSRLGSWQSYRAPSGGNGVIRVSSGFGIAAASEGTEWDSHAAKAAAPSWVDLRPVSPRPQYANGIQQSIGWPVKATTGWAYQSVGAPPTTIAYYRLPWMRTVLGARSEWVPLSPLWRGVAINTLVLGSPALLLLLITPVRASRRRRNGECPRCAYDLKRDFARGCPECGWNKAPAETSAA